MLDILKSLESTSSRNEKLDILKGLDVQKAAAFKRLAYLAYDPSIDYWIKEYEKVDDHLDCVSLFDVLNDCENILSKRVFTGNMAKQWLEQQHEMLSEDNAEVLRRVILRDLRCGISAKTVNKVWPNTVYIHPYMRCSGFSEKNLSKIKYPCYSQTKMDGLYCDIMIYDGGTSTTVVECRTRNGSIIKLTTDEMNDALATQFDNEVLMGEALAVDEDGELMNRQASNGYLNSDDIDPERIRFFLWDVVPYDEHQAQKGTQSYETRFEYLKESVEGIDFLNVVDTVVCESKQDILDHFETLRKAGEEGSVIKNTAGIWKNGDSKDQIKMKVIFDCDLVPVEWKYGDKDTKYKDVVGSIRFETSDGKLSVWAGSGYTDKQRKDLLKTIDGLIESGTVGVVRGNDVIFNKDNPDLFSIFLPRFAGFRTDKREADTLERVQQQVKSFINALDQIK